MVILFSFLINWSYGTSFFVQPFPQIIEQAPVIVRGKVGMNYSDWGKDGEGIKRIYTYYELQVTEVLKGPLRSNSIVFRELGGEKDGVGLQIAGASQFEKGEDVVVLLKSKNSESSYDIQGMMMGKYNIQTDSTGQEILVGPGINGGAVSNSKISSSWTLEGVRQIIQKQEISHTIPHTLTNSPISPHQEISNSNDSPHLSIPNSTQTTAPQLQSLKNDQSNAHKSYIFLIEIGLGLIALFGILRTALRKK